MAAITQLVSQFQGSAVLVAGTVTPANVQVNANSFIAMSDTLFGGTTGILRFSTITASTGALSNGSFVITSSQGTDTATVAFLILS